MTWKGLLYYFTYFIFGKDEAELGKKNKKAWLDKGGLYNE